MVFIPTANCMCIPITYYLQRIYSISIPLYIITALSFFDGSAEHWWTLFLTGAAMGLIFCVTSCIIMCQSGPKNDEALGKSMEIGLKWISFSGVLPLLFVYTIGWSPCFLTSIIIICTFASEEFLNKFYKPTVGKTTTDYSFRPKTVCFLGFLHITGAALGINYSFKYKSFEDFLAVSIYQVIFTVFYGTCTIDYFVGASVVTIKDKRKQQEDMVTVCAKLAKEDPTRLGNGIKGCCLACEICRIEYSELTRFQTPRVLPKCGHTFCEGCLKKLISFGDRFHCPSCRVQTVVSEKSVLCLPKNYALISVLREVNTYLESHRLVNEISNA